MVVRPISKKSPAVRPTNLLDRIQRDMVRNGLQARTAQSRQWLLGMTQNLKPNTTRLMNNKSPTTKIISDVRPGFMYHFYYDPKLKKQLPYYDRFPLIIAIKRLPNGFHGLNLHYLPPMQRAFLLTKLESIASNKRWNETTKLNISYRILKSYAKFSEFRPCFKRYLIDHVHSGFLFIPASHWDIAVFLPTARFEKAKASEVWADSGF